MISRYHEVNLVLRRRPSQINGEHFSSKDGFSYGPDYPPLHVLLASLLERAKQHEFSVAPRSGLV